MSKNMNNKPHKPIRWVYLLNYPIDQINSRYINSIAKVETPIDKDGNILVNVEGKYTYEKWIKWKNTNVSSDLPINLANSLELQINKFGKLNICDLSYEDLTYNNLIKITFDMEICKHCGFFENEHLNDIKPSVYTERSPIDDFKECTVFDVMAQQCLYF